MNIVRIMTFTCVGLLGLMAFQGLRPMHGIKDYIHV